MVLVQQERRARPKVLASALAIYVEGRLVQLDPDGYLIDPADWSVALSEQMAVVDDLILTDDHWLLIGFLHYYYQECHRAPNLQVISRQLCKDRQNCRWNRKYIQKLFPGGIRTACRYAGLQAPGDRGPIR